MAGRSHQPSAVSHDRDRVMHVYIEDIAAHEGKEVTIKGWLHNRRSSGKIHFLILRDGTGFIQAVMSKAAVGDDVFKAADHLSQETSVIVTGTVRDRKSTRLNSSHVSISYAVFCLKKKKQ